MQYWIDKESESSNVITISDSSIFIGSCDKESCDKVDQQLKEDKSPIEVLGSDDLTVIPYSQIQNMVSRSTDINVDISYKAKKDIEEKTLYFSALGEKNDFISSIEKFMPEHLEKSESEQSAVMAAVSPLISLTLSLSSAYLFFDKFRWPAIVVGGIWAIISIYILVSRVSEPPKITRWAISGRYFRKLWAGIKTGFSYVVLVLIIIGVYGSIPDSYGEKSIYEQINDESLDASDITLLIERGADIDYEDKEGTNSLSIALNWGENDLAIALIEAGADLSGKDSEESPLEYAIYNDANINVIEAMLDKGASLEFEIDGTSPLEYSQKYENNELANLIMKYTK